MSGPILAIDRLTMAFGGLTAVENFSMSVTPGCVHAVIGPNGAGKSTVFNCVSRFYAPTAGVIRFQGQDISHVPAHRIAHLGIARTFQNLELFGNLSVHENVLIGMHSRLGGSERDMLRGRSKGEIEDEVDRILDRTGLLAYRRTPASALDFGHQKMLELARALAVRPVLLLLDEPAAGLRNREIEALDRLLVELCRDDGITIVLVEHVMQLVMSVSDRITVLNFGRKIAEGEPDEIRCNPQVIEAYLGRGSAGHA